MTLQEWMSTEKVCFQKEVHASHLGSWDDPETSKFEQDEDANMCLNANFDYEINEVTDLSYCLFHWQLKNDFENHRNSESFLTNKCHYLQKEIEVWGSKARKYFKLWIKKTVQNLQDSYFDLSEPRRALTSEQIHL